MHGSDTACQVMDPDINKAGPLHHSLESFTIGKFKYGVRQVLVSAALREEPAEPGQDA